MTDKELLKRLVEKRPINCAECGGKLHYIGVGEYECVNCGCIVLDDFGKVRNYLYENGSMPAPIVSAATGVSPNLVVEMLKSGRIEILENSKAFISCEKCGCSIRYGRICPDCVRGEMTKMYTEMDGIVGEKPQEKKMVQSRQKERMRYFSRDSIKKFNY